MLKWFAQLDRILRGQTTHPSQLQRGQLDLPVRGLLVVLTLLGMFYGFCMGWFAVLRDDPQYMQVVASMIKVPLLFFLTLVVTFPSLYVFNALVGSRLSFTAMLRLLIASQAVLLAVLASFGPIVAFFSVTSNTYYFILLLNVGVFGLAGLLGINFLLQTLQRLTDALYVSSSAPVSGSAPAPQQPPAAATEPSTASTSAPPGELEERIDTESRPSPAPPFAVRPADGPLSRMERPDHRDRVRLVFNIWVVTFAIVGGQMGWVLRPFIGHPSAPFTWFRTRQSNFFEGVVQALTRLFQ